MNRAGVGCRCLVVTVVSSRDFHIHQTGMMISEMFGTETERLFLTGNEGYGQSRFGHKGPLSNNTMGGWQKGRGTAGKKVGLSDWVDGIILQAPIPCKLYLNVKLKQKPLETGSRGVHRSWGSSWKS